MRPARANPSPGLAFWADRGQPTLARIATAEADASGVLGWAERIAKHWETGREARETNSGELLRAEA